MCTSMSRPGPRTETPEGDTRRRPTRLLLCGDVMTGRGIDQILRDPVEPHIYEPYMRSAVGYVELAEAVSGPIPRGVDPAYVWGDALAEFERRRPDLRVVNLETSVTQSDDHWPAKGIHYRMNPANVACLTAGGLDGCVLANNHVLDWGYAGLTETLATLRRAGIATAGAGQNLSQASRPAIFPLDGGGRLLVYACGARSSGIPVGWMATADRAGVNGINRLSAATARRVGEDIRAVRRPGDIIVVSVPWGGNWGYRVPHDQTEFAHRLIEDAGVDVVHGHSSHHAKAIEVYEGRLILYGCGDFITDYEGIGGHERYRGDLSNMYFVDLAASGELAGLIVCPMRMHRFQVRRCGPDDADWMAKRLTAEGEKFNTRVVADAGGDLSLVWS